MSYEYFIASDDEAAGSTVRWADGPSRPPAALAGFASLALTDIQPSPWTYKELRAALSGESFGIADLFGPISDSEIRGWAPVASQPPRRVVVRVPDDLVTALADVDPEALDTIGRDWTTHHPMSEPGDIDRLAALARAAVEHSDHLYCWSDSIGVATTTLIPGGDSA